MYICAHDVRNVSEVVGVIAKCDEHSWVCCEQSQASEIGCANEARLCCVCLAKGWHGDWKTLRFGTTIQRQLKTPKQRIQRYIPKVFSSLSVLPNLFGLVL